MSKSSDIHTYKKDIELFEYMLEKSEVDFEHLTDGGESSFELENGILINFDDSGELINLSKKEGCGFCKKACGNEWCSTKE